MNHIYRIVKNKKTGLWVVACEIARSHSGGAASALVVGAFGLAGMAQLAMAADPSAIPISSSKASVAMAPNNTATTVVNIQAPTAAGLSHNQYSKFNVTKGGLILNNADGLNNLTVETKLAGQILANQNLTHSALVILNEVMTNNASILNGFIEVAGTKADVLVANYNGITCATCGFINTGRATLTTGLPVVTNGALTGLNVTQGSITISGNGLNAGGTDLMDLLARKVTIDGPINAPALEIHTGAAQWNYASDTKTTQAGTDSTPDYAIDASALGGMYANTIKLIASEAGVGVRMLGEVAAASGDFTLDASGKIAIKAKMSASRDLGITTTVAGADALTIVNSPISAGRDLRLSSAAGATSIEGGQLYADRNMGLTAASLTDTATVDPQVSNNQRTAMNDLSVTVTGATALGETTWRATRNLDLESGTLTTGANTQLASSAAMNLTTRGAMNLGQAQVQSTGNMTLDAGTGTITIAADGGQGVTSSAAISVSAGTLANAGTVQSATGASYDVTTVNNTGTLANTANNLRMTGTTLSNDGKISSETGTLALSGNINLGADGVVQTTRGLSLNAGSLTFSAPTARILGATNTTNATDALNVTVASNFTNTAMLYSGKELSLSAPAITNAATGGIAAGGNMTLAATATDIINYGALYAGGNIDATATATPTSGIYNYVTLGAMAQDALLGVDQTNRSWYSYKQVLLSQSSLDAGGSISLTAGKIVNSSIINAGGNLTLSAATIWNQVQGGDSRAFTPKLDYTPVMQDLGYYSFPNKYQRDYYSTTWHINQYFALGLPALKPQLNAGSALTLQNFADGKNLGGSLQAPTIVVSGLAGASFTNDDLSLVLRSYRKEWHRNIDFKLLGPMESSSDIQSEPADSSIEPSTSTVSTFGASLKANTLNVTVANLTNNSSPFAPVTAAIGAPGTTPNAQVSGGRIATAAIPGLSLTLPRNPNGYFVTNRSPTAKFLVESNPMFQAGGSTVGSDYLAQKLGMNPDTTQKRLGDASYEAYLVQQQLVAQTGAGLLDGQQDLAGQIQSMMDGAANQAGSLGLVYGQAPTAEQLANLTESIIWMVEVEVDGQKVLAPVVYLAPATLASLESGAVIAADKTTIDVTTMANNGGTIVGGDSLAITAKGDITNLSGSIKGGDVSLKSTEGSIKNETLAQGTGAGGNVGTTVGKIAGIQATGNLALDAAKDITNIGAQMGAGGNASLKAGDNIVFDTVKDKNTTTTAGVISQGGNKGFESSTTTTVNQVKSGLTVGGNLDAKAGKDITLAGTDANVGGNAKIDAGGNLNIVARENTVSTQTESSISGVGVGGGVYGTTKTNTDAFSSRNVGSTLNIGGSADLTAGNTLTVQGSKLNVTGDTAIDAADIKVLAGKDVDTVTSKTVTTSFLQIENVGAPPESSSSSSAGGSASSGTGANAGAGNGSAGASASASAEASGSAAAGAGYTASAGVTLAKTVETVSSSLSQRSVGSELNLGGNVTIKAKNDVTLQGSALNVGGNLDLQATNVNLLAAQNIEQSSSSTTTTRLGLYASTDNQAGAQASGESSAQAGAGVSANSKGQTNSVGVEAGASAAASAQASAEASSKNTVDVLRIDKQDSESLQITNTGSSIKAGGNLKLDVANKLLLQGSTVEATGDVDLKAKDMAFEAVQDTSYSKESNSTMTMGVYLDAGAGAEAKGQANAQAGAGASAGNAGVAANAQANASASAGASGNAEASAKAGAGVQFKTKSNTQEDGASTALVSSIKSGSGSVSRTATGSIKDVGTNIEAATDFTQSATTIEMLAAQNSQFSKTTSEVNIARIGVYAEADAGVEGKASAGAEATASGGTTAAKGEAKATASASGKAEAGARVGVEMSFDRATSTDTSTASQAVVSNIKVGGNINSASSGKTTLQGTNLEAGGAVNLSASELEVLAARDTATQTSTTDTVNASMQVYLGVGAEAKGKASASTGDDENTASAEAEAGIQVGAKMSAGYTKDETKDEATRAVAANISGSKITINTTGKTSLEGTNLNAGDGGIDIAAKSLDFKAATDTFASSTSSVSFQADLAAKVTIGSMDAEAEGDVSVGVSGSQSSGTNAVVGSLSSAGGLNIRTQDDLRLQGTQINVGGDTNLSAGGNVTVDAAKNTFQASASSVDVSLSFNTGDKNFNAGVGVGSSSESSSQAVVSNINTGGSLNISAGKNATFEGANVAAGGDAQVAAMGDVTFKEARNESTSQSSQVDVSVGYGVNEDKNTNGTQSSTSSFNAGVSVTVENAKASEAVTGSFQAGKSLSVVSGGNTTFVGTDLAAGEGVSVAAGGDVNFKAAESTSSSSSVGVSVGIGTSNKTPTNQDPNETEEEGNVAFLFKDKDKGEKKDAAEEAPAEEGEPAEGTSKSKETVKVEASLDVGISSSTVQKGSNVNAGAGGIQISSGKNVALQGTQLQTTGAASVTAAGKVTQTAAVSTSTDFGFGISAGVTKEKESGSLVTPEPAAEGAEAKAADPADAKTDAKDDDKANAKADAKADAKVDDKTGAADAKTDGKAADPAAPADDKKEVPVFKNAEAKDQPTQGLRALTLESNSTVTNTTIAAAGGSTVKSGTAAQTTIAGVNMMLRATVSADGSNRTQVPVPGTLPAGTKVVAAMSDGRPLPSWVNFDAATGALTGTPPADLVGSVPIVVNVPMPDGTTFKVGVVFGN